MSTSRDFAIVAIGRIKPWGKNPRRSTNVDAVARSIERFGFAAPIVARRNGEIVAGHTRYLAAKKLGLKRVPVRYVDLTAADAEMLALADNRLAELNSWDDRGLREILGRLKDGDAKLAGWLRSSTQRRPETSAAPQLQGLRYQIVVSCRDEAHQAELIMALEQDGLECRPLIS